jgi:hypothetical protein
MQFYKMSLFFNCNFFGILQKIHKVNTRENLHSSRADNEMQIMKNEVFTWTENVKYDTETE